MEIKKWEYTTAVYDEDIDYLGGQGWEAYGYNDENGQHLFKKEKSELPRASFRG